MSKKILIIRNAAKTDFGGGERFPVFLAMALKNAGWRPIIISRSQKLLEFADTNSIAHRRGWWWSRQNWSGLKVLLVPFYAVWQIVLYFYYLILFLRLRPSAVHLQSKDDFIAGTFAAKTLGIHVVWTDHADLKHVWQNLRTWYKNPVGKMVYLAAHLADTITVVSKSEEQLVKQHLKNSSRINKKIVVVYNGVFDQKSEYDKPAKSNILNFVVASRLVKDKGIHEAVSAFTELKEESDNVSLTILGDGPDRADLETMSGAENVTFLGHAEDPLQYLRDADIFVHPTYHEGFSVALVEAGMMSLPIIATSVGGNVEIINDHETGLLVPARDSRSLHEAMRELLKNEKLRLELGMNARKQYISRFQFDKIVNEQFIPIYKGRHR